MATGKKGGVEAADVLAVLAGTPLDAKARQIGVRPADLADAIELYKEAGQRALRAQDSDSGWCHVRVRFTDWETAEYITATALAPELTHLQKDELVDAWWFIRKYPDWRLRLKPGPAYSGRMITLIKPALDELVQSGHVGEWRESVYEPELAAFGAQAGMDIAHVLFHADSAGVMDLARRLARPALGRRELSILLCTCMLRAAGQDWFEQGDIWRQVSGLRPLHPGTPADRLGELGPSTWLLLSGDTRASGRLFGPGGPLAFAMPWAGAFDAAGHALAEAAAAGTLDRGLRAVLAHHIIFHWNRLGLSDRTQAILAAAALDAIMNHNDQPPAGCGTDGP